MDNKKEFKDFVKYNEIDDDGIRNVQSIMGCGYATAHYIYSLEKRIEAMEQINLQNRSF